MYKVLIIDDEVLVKMGLKLTIDWESLGFSVVGEASNGNQGYEKYKQLMPDVIFTDIKMPQKDGIWLVNEIRKENKNVKLLMLTCYDDFDYVRKALKAGADDYILKTEIEDEDLIKLMMRLKEELDNEQNNTTLITSEAKNLNDAKRAVFNDLRHSKWKFNSTLENRCQKCNFKIEDVNYSFAMVSKIESEFLPNEVGNPAANINIVLMNLLVEIFENNGISYIYRDSGKEITLLMSMEHHAKKELDRIFERVQNASIQYFNLHLNIVYTEFFSASEQLNSRYENFIKQSRILYYKHPEKAILKKCEDIVFNEIDIFELKRKYNPIWVECYSEMDRTKIKTTMNELKELFVNNKPEPSTTKLYYLSIIGLIINQFKIFWEIGNQVLSYEEYHYKISNCDSFKCTHTIFEGFIEATLSAMRSMKFNNEELITQKAIRYIEENFSQQISLNDVALHLNMSKHYLSSVFSKITGENMSSYINRLRIDKAKMLLSNRETRVKDIYDKVGFSNQYYFSRVFKKITNMTVAEYKNSTNKS